MRQAFKKRIEKSLKKHRYRRKGSEGTWIAFARMAAFYKYGIAEDNSLTMMSIAFGIDTPSAQARRRTETQAISENCGV